MQYIWYCDRYFCCYYTTTKTAAVHSLTHYLPSPFHLTCWSPSSFCCAYRASQPPPTLAFTAQSDNSNSSAPNRQELHFSKAGGLQKITSDLHLRFTTGGLHAVKNICLCLVFFMSAETLLKLVGKPNPWHVSPCSSISAFCWTIEVNWATFL